MSLRTGLAAVALAVADLLLMPGPVRAQSVIAGMVKDTTGASIPGVTVEAASPALIEQVRTVVTDVDGQYRIVDLRPGDYTVTFSLAGFSTVRRAGIQLPANFTLTLNAELQVGALEETITVSGQSPMVDVQGTAKNQVINREALDSLPTGRSLHALAQLVVGVSLNRPDVGGSAAMQQTYMSVHGLASSQNTIEVDGLISAQSLTDGTNPQYWPQAFIQEMVYQTSGVGADATGGGVRANAIPRDGGNIYSGNVFLAGYPGKWVNNNVTQTLKDRGLGASNKVDLSYDSEAALGGPLKRDKLWFFTNVRYYGVNSFVAGTYVCEGCYGKATAPSTGPLGLDSQFVVPMYGRLTWQVSPRHKLAGYYDWVVKERDGDMASGTDPVTARRDWNYHVSYVGAVKWTSTMTDRLLVEVGFTPNLLTWTNDPVPHSKILDRGSSEWLNTPQKTDLNLGTTWNAPARALNNPVRYYSKGSISYVTGSHNIKTGAIYDFGHVRTTAELNADLIQRYRSGRPDSVALQNTPRDFTDIYRLLGLYVQDTWTIRRLTLNPGVRWEYLNGGNAAQRVPAGRFVGARAFPRVDNLPNWKTLSPRFGVAYDLFGNAKTAVKLSLNRYDMQRLTGFANQYNPLAGANISATLSWTDLDGNDLAQGDVGCIYLTPGCEINYAQLPADFGRRSLSTPDPAVKRPYTTETSVGVQHELLPRVSVSATWLRSSLKNAIYTYNTRWAFNDYTPVSVVSPLDGSIFTVYNLDRAKASQIANIDTNDPGGRVNYSSFEFNLNVRLPGAITLFGGSSTERTQQTKCDQPDNPNSLLFCDQRHHAIPWRTQFKLNGTYPLPWWGLQVAGSLQSLAPAFLPASAGGQTFNQVASSGAVNWQIAPTTRYAADCIGPCTPGALVIPNMTLATLVVPLTPANTQTLERLSQLDLSVSKSLKLGTFKTQFRFDVFNSLNSHPVLTVRSSNVGTPAYRQPASILDGRTFRAGMQMSF
jgi:hypothetical protein